MERGEVEVRHGLAQRWRPKRLRGIQRRLEFAVLDEAVHARGLGALPAGEILDLGDVALDRRCEIGEVERQKRRVRHAQGAATVDFGEYHAVDVAGVDEALVVLDGVVERVVRAAAALAAHGDIDGRDADVLEEGAVVGARAQRTESQPLFRQVLARLVVAGRANPGAVAIAKREPGLRIGHVALHLGPELRQRMAAAQTEKAASVGVGIGVEHGLFGEFLAVFLRPLGGTDQSLLLAIPGGEHQGATRRFGELRDRLGLGEHGDEAGDRVASAVAPGVAVVAAQHPLVRPAGAFETGDDVAGGDGAPVELDAQAHGGGSGADAVGDRQCAAPFDGRHRAFDGVEQRLGVAMADRQRRNRRHRGRFVPREPLGAFDGRPARGQQVARVQRQIHHGAALHAGGVLVRPLRVRLALVVAVVAGIRVDEAADGAVFRGELRLDAAEDAPVAGDGDLAG